MEKTKRKRSRLDTASTVKIAKFLNDRQTELSKQSPYKIAKLLNAEYGMRITPSNVVNVAKAAQIQIGLKPRRAKLNNKQIASLLERICLEVGIAEDHQLIQEIRALSLPPVP